MTKRHGWLWRFWTFHFGMFMLLLGSTMMIGSLVLAIVGLILGLEVRHYIAIGLLGFFPVVYGLFKDM